MRTRAFKNVKASGKAPMFAMVELGVYTLDDGNLKMLWCRGLTQLARGVRSSARSGIEPKLW